MLFRAKRLEPKGPSLQRVPEQKTDRRTTQRPQAERNRGRTDGTKTENRRSQDRDLCSRPPGASSLHGRLSHYYPAQPRPSVHEFLLPSEPEPGNARRPTGTPALPRHDALLLRGFRLSEPCTALEAGVRCRPPGRRPGDCHQHRQLDVRLRASRPIRGTDHGSSRITLPRTH